MDKRQELGQAPEECPVCIVGSSREGARGNAIERDRAQ